MTALLEVDGLCAGYGRVHGAARHRACTLEPATITAVLGANGAGKTTLLRALSGLLAPDRGDGAASTARTSPGARSSGSSRAAWRTCPRDAA